MMEAVREAVRQVASVMVTRGKVRRVRLGPQRAVLQVAVFRGEVKEGVELLLPPGMSAVPLGGDVLLFQVNGRRDHLVALVDDPGTRIADLKAGEFGFRDHVGQQAVFRADHLEITTPRKVVITATGDVVINSTGNVVLTPGGTVQLGGTGGRKAVLDGDPVSGGAVRATSTKVLGQ
jgi:phage gp45-like